MPIPLRTAMAALSGRRRQWTTLLVVAILSACTTPPASPTVSPLVSPSATSMSTAPTEVPPSPSPSPLPVAGPGRIVFTEYQGSGATFKIYTMNPDGSDLKVVFTGANAIPRWSPDGKQISITTSSVDSDHVATVINADGSGAHDLKRPDPTLALSCTAWSPDDNRLACEGWDPSKPGREGIYTIRSSDGGGLTRITTTTAGIHDIPGDFSADGTKVIFIRATYTVVSLGQLWIANVDGSGAHKIADALVGYRISWSRDGRWVAASANGTLLIFDVSDLAKAPFQIKIPHAMVTNPRWSPDGTELVFGLAPTAQYGRDVYTVNRDGTNPKRLTSGQKRDEYPDWGLSP